MTKISKYLLVTIFTIFLFPVFSSTSYANVLTVGENDDYSTIQAAINAAEDYDTIYISAGTYEENLTLEKNNIELIGDDRDTVILKSKTKANSYGIKIIDDNGNSNIKILNMTIEDFLYGIYGSEESNKISNLVISNIHFNSNGDTALPESCNTNNPYTSCGNWHDQGAAIYLRNVKDSKITNNLIENGERGILIHDVTYSNARNEISFNEIKNNQQYGIRLNNSGDENKILNNIISGNNGEAIEIYRTDGDKDEELEIKNNQIFENLNDGIRLENQRDFIIEDNEIYLNASLSYVPYPDGTDPVYGGIYINHSQTGSIKNNNFTDNSTYGIYLDSNSSGNSIYFNTITGHTSSPQAKDNGSFNSFSYDNQGNFWSDLSEDTYQILGTAVNKDSHPLESSPIKDIMIEFFHINLFTSNSISLKWNSVSDDEFDEYKIFIRKENSNDDIVFDSGTNFELNNIDTNQLEIWQLENNTSYTARITAITSDGFDEINSDEIEFKTLFSNDIPLPPVEIIAVSYETGKAFINWFPNPSDDNISYHEVYRKDDSSDYQYIKKVMSPNTYFYDSGLHPGKTYYYKIRGKNNNGLSTFSKEVLVESSSLFEFDSNRNINLFKSTDITKNTVISRTEDSRSELLFTPELADDIDTSGTIVSGLNANFDKDSFELIDSNYSFISDKIYNFSISDINSTISLENLPSDALISIKYSNDEVKTHNEDGLSIALYDKVQKRWIPLLSQINPNSNVVMARTKYLGLFKLVSRNNLMNFTDISVNNWAYGYVQNLSRSGIINGYEDMSFKPQNFTTRAEALKMTIKASGYKTSFFIFEKPCIDVEKDSWYSKYFQFALNREIIKGYDDKSCKPNQYITRIEALKLIVGDKSEGYDTYVEFDDIEDIPVWSYSYIRYAVDKGIISGYSDNTFKPNAPILRQELAKILYESYEI